MVNYDISGSTTPVYVGKSGFADGRSNYGDEECSYEDSAQDRNFVPS